MSGKSNLNINFELILAFASTLAALASAWFAKRANNLQHIPYLVILKPKFEPTFEPRLVFDVENQSSNIAFDIKITSYGLKNYFPLYLTKQNNFEPFVERIEANSTVVYKGPEYNFSYLPKGNNLDLYQIVVYLNCKTISGKKQKFVWLIDGPLMTDISKLNKWERFKFQIQVWASRIPLIYKWGSKLTEKKINKCGKKTVKNDEDSKVVWPQ